MDDTFFLNPEGIKVVMQSDTLISSYKGWHIYLQVSGGVIHSISICKEIWGMARKTRVSDTSQQRRYLAAGMKGWIDTDFFGRKMKDFLLERINATRIVLVSVWGEDLRVLKHSITGYVRENSWEEIDRIFQIRTEEDSLIFAAREMILF